MGTEKKFTVEEVEVLLLVKLLNEFEMYDDSESRECTLTEKIENFKESLSEKEDVAFQAGLDKMEETGLLVGDSENDVYGLTETGKTLFERLSLLEKFSDNSIKNIMNFQVYIKDFWNKHGKEIIKEFGKIEVNIIKVG